MSLENSPTDIAIVGMSALFPGAKDLRAYWQNILNKVDAIREAPDSWAEPYFEPDSTENDRLYTRKGGFVGDLAHFNPIEFGIMPNSVDGGDPDHFLALKLARDALADAGYIERPFNREQTGIILGRGTYINRGFTNLLQHGMIVDQTLDLLRQINPELDQDTLVKIRKELKAALPPFSAEMAPAMVPNVVTGRIANRLGLMGPNYVIDAACASSLVSIELAIKELLSHRCDMMLAGGTQVPTPPQLHMIFCQLKALSRTNIRPFDQSADGTFLSEGIGIVVLKRLNDAVRDGDRIYAVLKGVGSSSDGKALGLLAPRLEGEVLALQRTYQENSIDPDSIELIEAHGTGIPLGDRTEIQSLGRMFGERQGLLPQRALGSVKSMIGHCTIAAGIAGIIKNALALYHKILPPTLCDQVNPALEIEKTSFYINNETRPWIHGNPVTPRRAAVNAFGFGGVNAHAVLEEYTGIDQTQAVKHLNNQWSTELLTFSSDGRQALLDLLNNVQQILQANPTQPLANLAYTLSNCTSGTHRLAIIAKDVPDLQTKLNLVVEKLKDAARTRLQTRSGIYYAESKPKADLGKIAFLFPGEGAQYPNMLADLCLYFPQVRAWFDFLDEIFAGVREHPPSRFIFPPPTGLTEVQRYQVTEELYSLDVATETVFTASIALHELLSDLGVQCDVMVGHSTGENTALIASGIVKLSEQAQLRAKIHHLNRIYRDLEAADSIPKGVLLSVGAIESSLLKQLVDNFQGNLYLALDNCPNQSVLFGSESDIEQAIAQLGEWGGICTRLPFDRAYHTPLFAKVSEALGDYYDTLDVGSGHTCLYSCATTEAFPSEPEAIRTLALKQWSTRVRFQETIENLYNEGVKTFIEVGPGGNLTNFVNDILHKRDHLALSSNTQRRSGLEQIQQLLSQLFVNGTAINFAPLYEHREVSQINLDASVAIEASQQKAQPVLELTMPVMRLQPDFVQTLQNKNKRPTEQPVNPEPVVALEPQAIPAENEQLSSPSIPVQAVINSIPSVPFAPSPPLLAYDTPEQNVETVDSRLSIVSAHFDLMQEFLASQARVSASLYGAPYNDVEGNPLAADDFAIAPLTEEEAWPLLGQIIEQDTELLHAQRYFDMEHDLFLHDHTLGGTHALRDSTLSPLPVIPFTVSMEILAEAAACLFNGEKWVTGIYNVRSYRWLALEQGSLVLDILAKVQPQSAANTWDVHVQLFQVGNTDAVNPQLVFEGYVRLSDELPPSPTPTAFYLDNPEASHWADAELYTVGMFHGPRFQGVKHIRQVGQQGIEADLQVTAIDDFFSQCQRPVFQIDAPLLDAAGHLVAYWVAQSIGVQFHTFPFQVKAFHQYGVPLSPGQMVLCRGWMGFTSDRQIESGFEFLDECDRVIVRLEGFLEIFLNVPDEYHQCRNFTHTAYISKPWMQAETGLVCRRIDPFPNHFLDELGGVIKHVIAHLMLTAQEREFWYGLPEKGPRRSDWLLGRIAAKDALRQWAKQSFNLELSPIDIQILPTHLGKPLVQCSALESVGSLPDISISHSRGYVVAAVASRPNIQLGIDLERLDLTHVDDWLTSVFTEQELKLLPHSNKATMVGLWCAKEAAAKANGTGLEGVPNQWAITHYSRDSHQANVSHNKESFNVKLWYQDNEILAVCQF
ncbi:MAG: polyketide synthase dehydratase domain-containing protein [Symplocastrum torsivum CPER-KK1]|jgi:acyl transferase domain-containing protein/phosphopantetheinyl transferase|uniref:Polyketide synthase dehydratase domain-containing protein n=1 Tax=Symplocastrum torsivum CPER-KK1 TaxID=450513 RepID=A0A951PMY2_9CYAN|nr:polyketide synthase dehydratase domain-containing protein [Symplocastrum torsivum CPER-KK1]